jgi:hypothetical protein
MSERNPIIELHIDELVLRGFARADRFRIAEALQSELTRLFTEHSPGNALPRRIGIGQLNAGSFRVPMGTKPAAIGTQIGQSVYRQIAPTLGSSRKGMGRK